MAEKYITVNNHEYGIFFRHLRFRSFEEALRNSYFVDAYHDAVDSGQVNLYDRDGIVSDFKANAVTICYIEETDRSLVAKGYGFCSLEDQFSRSKGRKIALNRALNRMKKCVQ